MRFLSNCPGSAGSADHCWFSRRNWELVRIFCLLVVFLFATGLLTFFTASPDSGKSNARGDTLRRQASWTIPSTPEVKEKVLVWLEMVEGDEEVLSELRAKWVGSEDEEGVSDQFFHFVETVRQVLFGSRELILLCSEMLNSGIPPKFPILDDETIPSLVRNNLRLLYGRWLVDQRYYNEAREQLADLGAEDVIDPASLIFYQAVVAHRLIDKKSCLKSLSSLLENETQIPRRYLDLAKLMQADMAPLESESLDEVSRMMRNIENRLDLGRVGQRVRTEEEDVIGKLDKMIDELEKQAQQQASRGKAGGMNPFKPAGDSIAAGGKGPGDVDPKAIGKKSGWGNLPPKQRQEALQQISKDFPPHYREVIEEYFKKIARNSDGR